MQKGDATSASWSSSRGSICDIDDDAAAGHRMLADCLGVLQQHPDNMPSDRQHMTDHDSVVVGMVSSI